MNIKKNDGNELNNESKVTFKEKTSQWFNDKFMPGMSKFASQTHLTAIRDAFGILTPIIIGGSVSFLLGIILFGAGGNEQTSLLGLIAKWSGYVNVTKNPTTGSESWELLGAFKNINQIGGKIFQTIFDFSMGLFSLMIVIMLGWIYAGKRGLKEPVFVAVLNMVSYLILSVTWTSDGTKFNYFFDSKGMLAAILITFAVVEIFKLISSNKKLLIKMPKQVPPMVASGFSLLIPVFLTLLIVSSVNTASWAIGNYTHWDIMGSKTVALKGGEYGFVGLFFNAIAAPFTSFISGGNVGLGLGLTYQFLVGFFWFFGLNGSSVINGAFYPFLLQMFMDNATLVGQLGYDAAVDSGALNVISIQFLENYSQTTGWGHTGALLLAIGIFGKVREHKEVAKLSAVPAIFSINEPVTFGLPIMLHPILGVAAMFAMPITTFIAWLAVGPIGIVKYSYIMVPWTLPPGIGALLSTGLDWKAFVLAWVCLAAAFIWYVPFVLIANKYHKGLNVQMKIESGMTREEAIASVSQDEKEYQNAILVKKQAKKDHKLELKQLSPEEKSKLKHERQMKKLELENESKLLAAEEKAATKQVAQDSRKIIADIVEFGGYKIRVDGKTFAAAMSDEKMHEICRSLAKTHNATYYSIVKDSKIIEKVVIGE